MPFPLTLSLVAQKPDRLSERLEMQAKLSIEEKPHDQVKKAFLDKVDGCVDTEVDTRVDTRVDTNVNTGVESKWIPEWIPERIPERIYRRQTRS